MTRLDRWESATEWPLALAALVFLAAYAIPIAWPDVGESAIGGCEAVMRVTWLIFAADYLVRLSLAGTKWRWIRGHVLDLLAIALPVLRPLRLVRLVTLVSILNRAGSSRLRGKVVSYAIGATALLIVCGALAVTDAERGRPGATIVNLGDGFWWAMTTMTTVGYGDRFPVTTTGRCVAAALMVAGIALLGVVTATLASWLVERVTEASEDDQAATRAQVAQLSAEIAALRAQITASQEQQPTAAPRGTTRPEPGVHLPTPSPTGGSRPPRSPLPHPATLTRPGTDNEVTRTP